MKRHFAQTVLMLALAACNEAETGDNGGSEPGDATGTGPAMELPEHPQTFRITLSGSPCFGSCPTYSASLDQDGNVSFFGESCVARPGAFAHKVSARDARAVYDALYASPYPSLADRYTSKEDGCNLRTDSPTYRWQVSADDESKPLERYAGCEGVDGLGEVDALMQVLHERADVLRFLAPPTRFDCGRTGSAISDTNLRLSVEGQAHALLKIRKTNDWSGSFALENCGGELLATGDIETEPARWLLLAESHEPIVLPDALGEVGSLLVDFNSGAPPGEQESIAGVRALRADDDLVFDFAPATSCEP